MRRAATLGFACWACVAVLAQEPHEGPVSKEMDAFDRQVLVARIEYAGTNRTIIHVDGTRAVYPNDTVLKLTLHYLQGETNEQQPFGDPEAAKKDGTSKRLAEATAVVRDWRYAASFAFDRYLPPGEYAVSAFFVLGAQSRAVTRRYTAEYVPANERRNPCEHCRYHYGMTKAAVVDPTYAFADPTLQAQAGKPVWWRQKEDYRRRMMSLYADWYAQIIGARESLASAEFALLHFGPAEILAIDRLSAPLTAGGQEEQSALLAWHAIRAGLARCKQALAAARDMPHDPHRYWRLRVFGEGRGPGENLGNPVPQTDSVDLPWAFDYARPRLALVAAEMLAHHRTVACDVAPQLVVDLRNLRERTDGLIDIANRRIDGAIDTVLVRDLLGALERAPESERAAHSAALVAAYRNVMVTADAARYQTQRTMAADGRRLDLALGISVVMPVATWPVPGSLGSPPQNSPEQNDDRLGPGVRGEATK